MTRQDINDIRFATYTMCRFGIQTILSTLVIGAVGSVLLMTEVKAASLKPSSVVNDDVVRLGDLFDGVEKPDTVLGNSPQLGKDMLLNASVLRNIANRYNVAWSPSSANDQLTLHRSSQTVGKDAITDALKASLTEKGVNGNFTLTLTTANPEIILPGNVAGTVEIGSMNYTAGNDVFTATLASPSVANPVRTMQISGLINHMTSVPSVATSVRKGDIISASDVAWMDIPERSVNKDTLLDADDIIGKTPSRVLSANRPIRASDVENPQLVDRGDDVTILFVQGGMTLTAKGKSQQKGAQGDLIRVVNLSSAKSFSAEVTGDHTVTVQ